jgi:hypothetical protein
MRKSTSAGPPSRRRQQRADRLLVDCFSRSRDAILSEIERLRSDAVAGKKTRRRP